MQPVYSAGQANWAKKERDRWTSDKTNRNISLLFDNSQLVLNIDWLKDNFQNSVKMQYSLQFQASTEGLVTNLISSAEKIKE